MIVSTTKMTAAQYRQLGEDPPGVRLELVAREIAVSAGATPSHSFTLVRIVQIVGGHVEQYDLGMVLPSLDTVIDTYNVRRPDVLFISKPRLGILTSDRMTAEPDLCIEVISPSSERIDREDKFKQYAEAGVPHYWIADPETRRFDAYELRGGAYVQAAAASGDATVSAPPFADLMIPLAKLWM